MMLLSYSARRDPEFHTSNDPEVNVQCSGCLVHCNNVCQVQLKVYVWIGRLNHITSVRITKHAIAGHLDIESMEFTIPERLRKDPFPALPTSCKTLQRFAIFAPYKSFVVGIPMELEQLLVLQVRRYLQLDLEPVC